MKTRPPLQRMILSLGIILLAYVLGYAFLRTARVQTWKQDGQDYVIFPREPIAVYYLYRPVALVDGKITGMKFHIGPH